MPQLGTFHQVVQEKTLFDKKCLRLLMKNQWNKVIVQQVTDHYIRHLETSHQVVQEQQRQTGLDKTCVGLLMENARNNKAIGCFRVAVER